MLTGCYLRHFRRIEGQDGQGFNRIFAFMRIWRCRWRSIRVVATLQNRGRYHRVTGCPSCCWQNAWRERLLLRDGTEPEPEAGRGGIERF